MEGKVYWDGKRSGETAEATGEENRKLKRVVVELTLDNRALKDVLAKTF